MENWYNKLDKKYKVKSFNPNKGKTHELDIPFRLCLVGASGSGKSNALLNLLKALSGTLTHVYLVCKSKDEPLYEMLSDKLGDNMTIYEDGEVPPLDEFDGDGESLFVFDDLVGDKSANQRVLEYFKRGRKKGISCAYLSQSWFRIDKFLRQNTSHVLIKKVSSVKDLKLILSEFSLNCDIADLKRMYDYCTKRFEDIMLIDLLHGQIFHEKL